MSYIDPAAAEHLRKRWTRNDAYRFAPPGSPEAKMPGNWPSPTALAPIVDAPFADDAAEREALERKLLQLRCEFAALKLEYALRRFQRKYSPDQPRVPAGNPDGGKWTSGGENAPKESGSDRARSTEISASRRNSRPIPPLSPGQQVRLDFANARAQEAVARVQQLDPNWKSSQSLTDPNSAEGLIRAKEDMTREADARFLALSRAGEDAPYPAPNPRTTAEVLAPGGQLVGDRDRSAGENIRTITPDQFETIRTALMAGARQIEADARYDGVWYQRQDGTRFGLRISSDYGLTLDVIRGDYYVPEGLRFHQR